MFFHHLFTMHCTKGIGVIHRCNTVDIHIFAQLNFHAHTSSFYLFYCDNNFRLCQNLAHLKPYVKCAKICTVRKCAKDRCPVTTRC